MNLKFYYLLFLSVIFLSGCDITKIHKRDGCPFCRAAFQTNVQNTELRLADGSQIARFDNVGCALRFKAQHPEYAQSEIYVQTNSAEPAVNAKDLTFDDVQVEKYPHRYFAAANGRISFRKLQQMILSDLQSSVKTIF